MTKYKTVKRKPRFGERILITNAILDDALYHDGEVYDVKQTVPEGVFTYNNILIHDEEYEVIVGQHSQLPNLFEMDYDELIALVEDAMKALRTRSYKNGYDQGRFDAEIEAPKSDQQKRDDVVEKAKKDVRGLLVGDYGTTTEFIVNAEKRTVVALRKWIVRGCIRERGISKCAPNDCFNAHIGKAIALRRALGLEVPSEYLNVPQPTDVRVGDVVNYRNAYVLEVVDDSHIPGAKPVSTIRISALQGSGGGYVIIDDSRAGEGE